MRRRKRRAVRLGFPASEHDTRAEYHRNSAVHAIGRGLRALDDLDCSRAFSEHSAAQRYIGHWEAHTVAAGRRASPGTAKGLDDIYRLEVDLGRQCLRPKSDFAVRKQRGRGKN